MKKSFIPSYIINCFEATGYDTLDAVCEMDGDGSISEIEKYINKQNSVYHHACDQTMMMRHMLRHHLNFHLVIGKSYLSSSDQFMRNISQHLKPPVAILNHPFLHLKNVKQWIIQKWEKIYLLFYQISEGKYYIGQRTTTKVN